MNILAAIGCAFLAIFVIVGLLRFSFGVPVLVLVIGVGIAAYIGIGNRLGGNRGGGNGSGGNPPAPGE